MIRKYINLDQTFDPFSVDGMLAQTIQFSNFTFKGGEPHIKILMPHMSVEMNRIEVYISHRIMDYRDLGLLEVAVDALRGLGFTKLFLTLPYFPGARQDRRMVEGEPFTSAIYVKALSKMNFIEIVSMDLHSDVVAGMFAVLDSPRKFHDISNHLFVDECLVDIEGKDSDDTDVTIISPDAGSNKKIKALGMHLSNDMYSYPIVKCDKTRDVLTGEITGFEVYSGNLNGRDAVIVDDICDGGGTFIGLAEELKKRGAKRVFLVVTHGIFSRGIKVLTDVFDGVYCTNSCSSTKYHEGIVSSKFHIIPLKYSL
jgi:ribose-phosphate pyrophosphokinase